MQEIISVYINPATIGKYMLKLGYTYRRLDIVAHQRNEHLRCEYIQFVAKLDSSTLLFLDETSADSTIQQRKYGYARKGHKTGNTVIGDYVRKNRFSLLAGLDENGIVGTFIVEKAFNSDLFNLAIETEILPYVGSFAHGEPRSVVVMDNCSIHNEHTIALIHSRGGIVLFLPPYSPDFNPIEKAFNQIKLWLMAHPDFAREQLKDALILGCCWCNHH